MQNVNPQAKFISGKRQGCIIQYKNPKTKNKQDIS